MSPVEANALTLEEADAMNAERAIFEIIGDSPDSDFAITVFRGALTVQCARDDQCNNDCDGSGRCHWVVRDGERLVVEVYDLAETRIFFELPAETEGPLRSLATVLKLQRDVRYLLVNPPPPSMEDTT